MTKLVGILNITPDSFSDGGKFITTETALTHARQLIEQGTAVIDIGAESTRPGAMVLSHEEEWLRLKEILPELVAMLKELPVLLSVDTRHPENAEKAILLGCHWINDVSGADDPRMRKLIADSQVSIVIMHHLGIPAQRDVVIPSGTNVMETITQWAEGKMTQLQEAGIAKDRIIIDPGIGFGKSAAQSWEVIRHIDQLRMLDTALFVGHSRKSFLSEGLYSASNRDIETYIITSHLAHHHVDYIRVHDVEGNKRALAIQHNLGSII